MTRAVYDVVIVGAGIVGAACAAEAARAGFRIAVVEAGFIGQGATAAGMGHIVVMDGSEAEFALTRYSRQLWQELAEELPPDCEYSRCGTLWVAADEQEMAELERKRRFYSERGVAVEVLDRQALAEAEPFLRPGLVGGLRVPDDSVIYPPAAARFLIERAQAAGATVLLGQTVVAITPEGVRLSDGSRLGAAKIVNATGSWSPDLMPEFPIAKRKGHLVITDRYHGLVRHQIVELGYIKGAHGAMSEVVAFNVQPRPTGQILIGSSRQYGVETTTVDRQILSRMLKRACHYLPALAGLSALRVWTGFRAATSDHLPFIGPVRDSDRIYLATGHEGLGITMSLATAKLLVAHWLGEPSPIPLEPYLPSRRSLSLTHA
ncbi:MAG TPA: FAD-dependent oxidoreductase [Blastocatellia bacterium]|nr:FAD-dependent oxidoreductase [Blastocatellia bacterium]